MTQFFDKLQQANDTAERQRKLQKENPDSANDRSFASQTGARDYPVPPFPKQHIPKPGEEAALTPAPMYDAPYYKGSEKLKDKVALITGGDSGIGRAVAVLYAREGASVIVLYLEEENDAAYTQKLVEQEGRKCLLIKGDVRDLQFCKDAVEQAMSSFGQLDILVNNAAFQLHTDHFRDLSSEHFDETIKTNLYGYFNMTKAVLPHLKKGASIINTGSVTGLRGSKNLVDYSMTKGGIHAYTRALAGNLLPKGIRVNAVAPGPVWTPLNPADQAASDVAHFGSDTPMKRPAQPEELAPAYVFWPLSKPQVISREKFSPLLAATEYEYQWSQAAYAAGNYQFSGCVCSECGASCGDGVCEVGLLIIQTRNKISKTANIR